MNKFPCLIHENCNIELIIDYHCHILATIPSKCASEEVPGPLNPWKEKEMAVPRTQKKFKKQYDLSYGRMLIFGQPQIHNTIT
jgi:hypothetical protein